MRCIIFRDQIDATLGDQCWVPYVFASICGQDHIEGLKGYGGTEAMRLLIELNQLECGPEIQDVLNAMLTLLPSTKKEEGETSIQQALALKSFFDGGAPPTLIDAGVGEEEQDFESALYEFLNEKDDQGKLRRGDFAGRIKNSIDNNGIPDANEVGSLLLDEPPLLEAKDGWVVAQAGKRRTRHQNRETVATQADARFFLSLHNPFAELEHLPEDQPRKRAKGKRQEAQEKSGARGKNSGKKEKNKAKRSTKTEKKSGTKSGSKEGEGATSGRKRKNTEETPDPNKKKKTMNAQRAESEALKREFHEVSISIGSLPSCVNESFGPEFVQHVIDTTVVMNEVRNWSNLEMTQEWLKKCKCS